MSSSSSSYTEIASGKLVVDEPTSNVVRIRIANPEKRGALDHEILDTLADTVRNLDAVCLVITGTDTVFSAGYDIGNFPESAADGFSDAAERLVAHPFTEAMEAIEAYPYPVVAAINGHAIGGGLELAVTCDIRVATRGVRLGMPPAKIGLVYSYTGLRKFIDVCGVGNTGELFYTGRNVDAERAYEMGLVNQVVEAHELEPTALGLAADIGKNSPMSLRGNKRIIRTLVAHAGDLPAIEARRLVELREACFRSEDFHEGIQAFAEKRPPRWSGH
ncbi:MAG TPA: enoyl-CoA hydratase-related protein [Thermoleophilaceae bacterium]